MGFRSSDGHFSLEPIAGAGQTRQNRVFTAPPREGYLQDTLLRVNADGHLVFLVHPVGWDGAPDGTLSDWGYLYLGSADAVDVAAVSHDEGWFDFRLLTERGRVLVRQTSSDWSRDGGRARRFQEMTQSSD